MRRRNNRKWLWWGMGIFCVVLVVVLVVVIRNVTNRGVEIDETQYKQNEERSYEEKDEEKIDDEKIDDEKEIVEKKEEVKQYDGRDPNESESLTGVISYADVKESNLLVRVNIDQYLHDGICKLKLLKDGAYAYSSEVDIVDSVRTSTCDGFLIPLAGLSGGKYGIEVLLESGGKNGRIVGEVFI